jgi:hypothetical protein
MVYMGRPPADCRLGVNFSVCEHYTLVGRYVKERRTVDVKKTLWAQPLPFISPDQGLSTEEGRRWSNHAMPGWMKTDENRRRSFFQIDCTFCPGYAILII